MKDRFKVVITDLIVEPLDFERSVLDQVADVIALNAMSESARDPGMQCARLWDRRSRGFSHRDGGDARPWHASVKQPTKSSTLPRLLTHSKTNTWLARESTCWNRNRLQKTVRS